MLALPFATRSLKPLSLTQLIPSNKKKSLIPFSLSAPMDSPNQPQTPQHYQNVVVMRHGDRLDNFERLWVSTAARPWDPPLVESGRNRAFCTGRKLRKNLGFPIHRVFVSPFLRCVQTAAEAISALCALVEDPTSVSSAAAAIDPSKVKVSIESGLCEMLNNEAIRSQSAPPNGDFAFKLSELQALFPAGTVDHSFEPVYKELPKWPEKVEGSRNRYVQVIKSLADKYPTENLLLVTHGEGVGVAVSAFMEGVTVYEVEYCANTVLRRPVVYKDESIISTLGEFEVLNHSGIRYLPLRGANDDEFSSD